MIFRNSQFQASNFKSNIRAFVANFNPDVFLSHECTNNFIKYPLIKVRFFNR